MVASQPSLAARPLFELPLEGIGPIGDIVLRFARPVIESLLGLPQINSLHHRISALGPDQKFSERSLKSLNIRVRISDEQIRRVPAVGSLIVVANHPFGGVDGLALTALIQRRRMDVKILANHLLASIPEMAEQCFFVDPFGGVGSAQRNIAGMRSALRWVQDGGALIVFPAGEVSSLKLHDRAVSDRPWSRHLAGFIRRTKAPVLPVFFAGRNSNAFQAAGLISPRLRTLMLPRELLAKRNCEIDLQIGSVITSQKMAEFGNNAELADYLRLRTYLLGARRKTSNTPRARTPNAEMEPIRSAPRSDDVAAEIVRLGENRCLARHNEFQVMYGSAQELPMTLQEIGRLREITFRRVGEGTGRSTDLDRFDQTYLHLLVWNVQKEEVVGAYRMGLTDQLTQQSGAAGLYASTLFRFREELLKQLGPAIELGRSFVREEYQKEYAPLMLLWKGIALFAARFPRYRKLFGPVSISNEYHSLTRQLLIEFLKQNNTSGNLQRLVAPRNPPDFGATRRWEARLAGSIVRSIEAIDELVGEIESDRLGVPVLLRQYLKLNAKLLGFNVDPDFGDVLDGLMLVDLTEVQRAILVRYMGKQAATSFLAFHGINL